MAALGGMSCTRLIFPFLDEAIPHEDRLELSLLHSTPESVAKLRELLDVVVRS
jgi:hypothetical protein